jgi:hypothetical protein
MAAVESMSTIYKVVPARITSAVAYVVARMLAGGAI